MLFMFIVNRFWEFFISTAILRPFWIFYPLMEYTDQEGCKAPLYRMKVFQGQFTFIELPIEKDVFDDVLYVAFNPFGGWIIENAGGSLYGIGKHDDARFLCLRFRPSIPEVTVLDYVKVLIFHLLGLGVEETDKSRSVMLLNDLLDLPADLVLVGHLDPFLDVGQDDQGAHVGGEVLVGIPRVCPVLDVVMGHLELPDIMIVRGNPGQQGVGAYAFRRRLGKIAHDNTVVVGAWGVNHHLTQKRMFKIGQLKELDVRRVIEEALDNGKNAEGDKAARDTIEKDKPDAQRKIVERPAKEEIKDDHQGSHHKSRIEAGLEYDIAALAFTRKMGGKNIAYKGVKENRQTPVEDKAHDYGKNSGEDYGSLGEKDSPENDSKKENGNDVEQVCHILRSIPLEDYETGLDDEGAEDGEEGGKEEVLLCKGELLDVPSGIFKDNTDEGKEKDKEGDEFLDAEEVPLRKLFHSGQPLQAFFVDSIAFTDNDFAFLDRHIRIRNGKVHR